MSYRNVPNWPPAWTWLGGGENKHPKGEVGTLKAVICLLSNRLIDVSYSLNMMKRRISAVFYLMTVPSAIKPVSC
jgi:hypothetical protein